MTQVMSHCSGLSFGVRCVLLRFSSLTNRTEVRKLNCSPPEIKRDDTVEYLWDRTEANRNRNFLFDEEKKRQRTLTPRIEKIEVNLYNIKPHEDVTLLMNRNMSTPYHCAQHVSELLTKRSVVALTDEKDLWDMHRPLVDNCRLTFKHFKDENPSEVNKAFWRSCSFSLGMVIQRAFKSDIPVILHSWPKPSVKCGSFIYDVQLPSLNDWKPSPSELRSLTSMFWQLKANSMPFERLDVSMNLAKDIFQDNVHKLKQLESISKESNDEQRITIYRLNDHLDFSIGPMIANVGQIGRVSVTCVHKLDSSIENLYRFQGVAIPTDLPIHFFAFRVLLDRGAKPLLQSIPP
ncbi:mitochondrial ribosomal protein L39 [Brevipalpus obovatus]|uniref:mitochondrial ribosomal protein L39 n=1 Tax=Brevipalpus obovatus TaxID=246614 RepID=UPI003D9F33D1